MVDMTVVFLVSDRMKTFELVLKNFFEQNSYPIKKAIVVHDGPTNKDLNFLMNTYKNTTWIVTNIKVGQLEAIDQAYKYIETEHYFYAEGDFDYMRSGFIEYCLQSMQYSPNISYTTIYEGFRSFNRLLKVGPLNTVNHFNSYFSGFSFWPSVYKMSHYRLIEGGYNFATFNLSYGKGAGTCQ